MSEKILLIDLTAKTSRVEELSRDVIRKFVGGRGLGSKLLYDLVKPDTDPLGPENALIFTAGPLQGSGIPFSGRTQLITKSPQTGLYLYTNAGGTLGINIRSCGFAAVVITGKSEYPVFLQVVDENAQFRDARPFWGLQTSDAQRAIKQAGKLKDCSVAVIGPAGENLVRTACVVTEDERRRVFGRGGCGAVFGSKNLKGIMIKGNNKPEPIHKDLFNKAKKTIVDMVRAKPDWRNGRIKYGTPADILTLNELGILPTRNWKTGVFEKVENLSPHVFREKYVLRDVPCSPYCITPCSKVTLVREGPYAGYSSDGPEYETIYSLGSNCGIDNYDAIIAADRTCDELGLDTIAAGVTIGFAMECFERGLISKTDCDGLELRFGNHSVLLPLLHAMAYGRGLGKILSHGVKAASEQIGQGSDAFAMHAKGMEFGGYECRAAFGQALQFALSNRGGCHHDLGLPARVEMNNGTNLNIGGKGGLVKRAAIMRVVYDSAILCSFGRSVLGIEPIVQAVSAMWGENVTLEGLEAAALRTLNLERCYNVLAGVRRKDDRLPDRLLKEPLPEGPHQGSVVPLEELKDEFYHSFGWNTLTGIPEQDTLAGLGLEEEAGKLLKIGK